MLREIHLHRRTYSADSGNQHRAAPVAHKAQMDAKTMSTFCATLLGFDAYHHGSVPSLPTRKVSTAGTYVP